MAKKSLFILLISLIYCLAAKAQKDTLVYYMKIFHLSDTRTHEEAVKIEYKDSADYFRVIFPPDTSVDKDLFIVKDYYKNRKLKMIGTSTSRDYHARFSGPCTEFYPNGKRKLVKNYDNGNLIGDQIQYFPNGKLYLTGSYDKMGKLIINKCLDSLGKVLADGGNGNCVLYDPDFKRVFAEGKLADGVEDGEWKGFLKDSARYVCTYEKGVLKNGIGYDKGGAAHPYGTSDFVDPSFQGGANGFLNFMAKTIRYPAVAKENNVQGKVYISFIVNKDGHLSDFQILWGVGSGCDEEVVRLMKLSPPWIPSIQFGIPVNSPFTIPISFTLMTDDDEKGRHR